MKRSALAGVLPALVLLAACDIPSAIPIWDMVWNVPAKDTTITVDKFLPAAQTGQPQVTVSSDKATFQFSPNPVSIVRTLSQDCPACAAANGQTTAKPAFTGTGSGSAALPPGVSSATLTATTLSVSINNGFNFDPIRPSAAAEGYIIIEVSNGTRTPATGACTNCIGRDSIPSRGATGVALPAGGSLATPRSIPLAGTISSAGIFVTVTLSSPLGDPITIDASRQITFTATTGTAKLSTATIAVSQPLPASSATLDLADIDKTITDHVKSGKLFMTVTNPFAISGTMTINFTGGSTPISKSITLTAASGTTPSVTTSTVTLTEAEVKSLLGHTVTMTYAGTVSGTTAVTPAQFATIASRLELTISTKGSE